jgi:HlyD family secretion protein
MTNHSTSQPRAEDRGKDTKRIRTLVVDDSPNARHAICYFLETQENIEIVGVAGDGQQALAQVEALQPDLVLMDMQMPEMNGLEATTQLRKLFPDIRVIIVTLYDSPESRTACRDSGAHGFVAKNRLHQDLPEEIQRIFSS